MATQLLTLSPSAFKVGQSYVVDWLDHPNFALPLSPGVLLDAQSRHYSYDMNGASQVISVDTSQNNGVGLNWCVSGFFDSNFAEQESVLWAGNSTRVPVLLTFNPPVLACGTHVSADGLAGETCWGFMYVRLSAAGSWEDPLLARGTISNQRDQAVYLGAQAPVNQKIHAVAYDMSYVGQTPAFPHVAIGLLDYIP